MSNTERDWVEEVGAPAYAAIVEMVAALDVDYDRLEELREERTFLEAADSDARAELFALGYVGNADEEIQARHAEVSDTARNSKAALANWVEQNAGELAELESDAGECTSRDEARERVQEDALSIEVRSPWYTPGSDDAERASSEFKILLTSGGPAVQIHGELDEHGEPYRAWLEVQEWGKPWTQYFKADRDVLLTYARCFYFGEG